MPEHYDPELTPRWRRLTGLAAWIAVAVGALVLDAARRYLSADAPRWRTLAHVVAVAIIAGGAYRAADALAGRWTVGPSHAAAAGIEAPAVATTDGADPATADGYGATPTADPRLQPGYSDPADDDAQAAGPGGPVLPTADGMFGPLDDGSPPAWLSAPLTPYWGTIAAAAHEVGLDSHWLGIVAMVENPQALTDAVTFDGGHGLAQIQRGTAAMIQAESGLPCLDGWSDPATSYRCGAWYFRGAVEDGAALARPGDAEPALLMGVAGYNSGHGSAIVNVLRSALASGAVDPCAAIGNQYTRRYCYSARDMWGQSLQARGTAPADAPAAAAPWRDPFGPRVAPGVAAAYLQAMNGEVGR